MSMSNRNSGESLPLEIVELIDKVCDRFEEFARAGRKPKAEDFLAKTKGRIRQALLVRLLEIELEYHSRQGVVPSVEEYVLRIPDQKELIESLFRKGEAATPEYEGREPGAPQTPDTPPTSSNPEAAATPTSQDTVTHRPGEPTVSYHDAAPAANKPPPPSIPGYVIESELGHGAMGVVYKARHLALKRTVALKMIRAGVHARPGELARFQIEAQAVARLQHPNIVQIHEVGVVDGHPYCALEYIEGGSLAERLDGKPMPVREAARLVETLALAMQLAHSRNVVHRDLKPANILLHNVASSQQPVASSKAAAEPSSPTDYWLLTTGYSPKITDFGLARQLDADSGETHAGTVMGTPSYMAPEQASGRAHEAGPAADVYALGAILYTCLTGRPPFRAKTVMETLDLVRSQDPTRPSRLLPNVPLDLETICLKCLNKEPERRYASAQALAEDLRHWQAGEPIAARPVGRGERAVMWARRRPALAGLVIVSCVAALAAVAGVVGLFYSTRLQNKNVELAVAVDEAVSQKGEADKQRAEADRLRELGRGYLYAANTNLAQRYWDEADIPRMRELLDEQRPERTGCADLRGFEWHYLWRLCHSELSEFTGHSHPVYSVAISPDGRRIASSGGPSVKVWDAATGLLILEFKYTSGNAISLAYSPDGRRLATGSNIGVVEIWDASTGKPTHTLMSNDDNDKSRHTAQVAFSPDGHRIVSTEPNHAVKVWDTESGLLVLDFKGRDSTITSVAYGPDGRRIVLGGWGTAMVWDAASGQEIHSLKGHTGSVTSVAFSPDGRLIASGGADHTVRVWDATTGQHLLALRGHTHRVATVAFSPDGSRIASGGYDRLVRVWDVGTGKEILTHKGHSDWIECVTFSPDGQRIVSGSRDKTIRLWDATTEPEGIVFKEHTNKPHCVAFSPDGRQIASGGAKSKGHISAREDRTVTVWDAATGQVIRTLKGHFGEVTCVAFSVDGKRIASGSDDHAIMVWDTATGQARHDLRGHKAQVNSVAFSRDYRFIASASSDKTVKLWDARTGQEVRVLKGHVAPVTSVSFSPNSRSVASSSSDKTIRVWDLATGQETLTCEGHAANVLSAAYSPDGRHIASGGMDKTVRVWDTRTGQVTLILRGHTQWIHCVAWSPDGKRIATGGGDLTYVNVGTYSIPGELKIWDTTTGQEVLGLKGHDELIWSVAFSPDGRRLASASWDMTVRLWDAEEVTPETRAARLELLPKRWLVSNRQDAVRASRAGKWSTAVSHFDRAIELGADDGQNLEWPSHRTCQRWAVAPGRARLRKGNCQRRRQLRHLVPSHPNSCRSRRRRPLSPSLR